MFKRVEKRIKRKKDEDELGLDEDMKDVLGLNDTDSDESESDVDSEDADQDIEVDDNNYDEMERDSDQESDDDGDDDDQTERFLITVEEALKDPIFIVSLDPDIKECIVCPGKLLKAPVMVETHKSSNAHERRFRQFTKLAENAEPRTRALDLVVKAIGEKKPELLSGTSNRAEKKRITQEKRKTKREKFKARQKAKKDTSVKTKEPSVSKEDVKPAKEKDNLPSEKQPKPKKKPQQQTGNITDAAQTSKNAQTSKKRGTAPESTEPPKKKRKTITTTSETDPSPIAKKISRAQPIPPSAKKPKSKPKPISEPSNESPEVIQDLQAQVTDIIKSASSLAKAARARALGDDAEGTKSPSVKKKKVTFSTSTVTKRKGKNGVRK